jgi:hypothetical protein
VTSEDKYQVLDAAINQSVLDKVISHKNKNGGFAVEVSNEFHTSTLLKWEFFFPSSF